MRHWRHRYPHRHGPPPFVRRLGCLFIALVMSTAIGVSMISRSDRAAAILLGVAVVLFLMVGFVFALLNIARHFRAQERVRKQLMADVAHELRTPLAILQGRVEGLLDGVYPRDDEQLQRLLDETRHLARLVEDVRTISNADAGSLELRKEPVDLAELIRDAAASFDMPIAVDVPEDLPPVEVDPVRIREVLLNLLSNAVRAGGTVAVHAEARGSSIVVRVADTGKGIAPEDLPRIFERFHKGADSRGSGLGLAIARNLVQAHGGTIRAESEVGKGTTITVALPR